MGILLLNTTGCIINIQRLVHNMYRLFSLLHIINMVVMVYSEYTVSVTAYPLNGPFRSRQSVPLLCSIAPTPPMPVEYVWRSSTANHVTANNVPMSSPITTVNINENHPIYGHYFCHVFSAVNHTVLAVGNITIHVSGELDTMYIKTKCRIWAIVLTL